jgi:hypothetical protein
MERVPETVRFKYRAFLSYSHPNTGSANMTSLQAELEAAFRKLPIAPPDDGGIPYEWLIPGIGGSNEAAMANQAGESNGKVLRLDFDRRLMLHFGGSVVTSEGISSSLEPVQELVE